MSYFYAVNGQQTGPVAEEELRRLLAAGTITSDSLVWREGMPDWQPVSKVLAGAAPSGQVDCVVCHKTFPPEETIKYGTQNVCAGCKPRFLQGLREGVAATGGLNFASIGARFGAKILDTIITSIAQWALLFAIVGTVSGQGGAETAAIVGQLLSFALALTYQIVFLGWKGQTLGKMAVGAKVVNPDGSPIGWGKAVGRAFAEMLSGCTIGIGYIIAFWDDEKRTLHDRLAGTRVIKLK